MLSAVQGASDRSFAARAGAEARARGGTERRRSDAHAPSRSDALSSRELGVLEELAKGYVVLRVSEQWLETDPAGVADAVYSLVTSGSIASSE